MNSFEHFPSFLKSELSNYYSLEEIDALLPMESFYTRIGSGTCFRETLQIPFNDDYYNELEDYGIEIYDIINKFIETQINNEYYRAVPITYDQVDELIYPEDQRINLNKVLGYDYDQYLVFNEHSEFAGAIIITETKNEIIITVSSMY